jgi:hypothetical protein
VRGLNHFERFFALDRYTEPKPVTVGASSYDDGLNYAVMIPRWKFEAARFGSWFVTFQLSFFLLLIVPLLAMRGLTGHDSIYAP